MLITEFYVVTAHIERNGWVGERHSSGAEWGIGRNRVDWVEKSSMDTERDVFVEEWFDCCTEAGIVFEGGEFGKEGV